MQTKYMPPILFTLAFALIMFAVTALLKEIFHLNVPDKTLQSLVVGLTMAFGYIMFRIFGL